MDYIIFVRFMYYLLQYQAMEQGKSLSNIINYQVAEQLEDAEDIARADHRREVPR